MVSVLSPLCHFQQNISYNCGCLYYWWRKINYPEKTQTWHKSLYNYEFLICQVSYTIYHVYLYIGRNWTHVWSAEGKH